MRTLVGLTLAFVAQAACAAYAGVYDGNCIGQIPPSGQHCQSIAVTTIAVPANSLSGVVHILGDKHILLKTRDVEVRGSNGRFCDVVHGVSVWNGVRVEDVYFHVTN